MEGKKADKPTGPEAVTRALITAPGKVSNGVSRVPDGKRLTAIATCLFLESQSLEHVGGGNVLFLCPEFAKALLEIDDAPE